LARTNASREPNIEPALRHLKIRRQHDVDAIEARINRRGRLDRLMHGLERDPGAGEARHRPAVKAVVEHFLHTCRIEDRNHRIDEVIFGLVRRGRRLGGVIVAHEREHAAVFGGAG
jgi:hypothetical protein